MADFYKEMNFEAENSQGFGELSRDPATAGSYSGLSGKRAPQLPPFEFTGDPSDLVKFVDHNERRHQLEAQRFLKQNSQLGTLGPDSKQIVK